MMKRFFLLALGAYALAGSVKADDPQIMIHSTHAEEDARTLAFARARDQAVDADPVPEIGDRYDSEPMIKMYLHDLGYNEASDAQVTQIATYMRANHIHHVSQLGQ